MRDVLRRGLPALGLSAELAEPLAQFASLVLEKNKVMNLTAITQPKEMAALHLLDSLCLLPYGGDWHGQSLLDVGTGAGFPGIPLAIALPDTRITLLDSTGKRISFLRESIGTLGLHNVACVHARAEEYAQECRETFDTVVSRAVAALPVLCELCLPLVRVGGRFLAMTSCHGGDGVPENALRQLGGNPLFMEDYRIPTTDIVHRVVAIGKEAPTPSAYPRRYAQIKKQPLGSERK